MPPSVTAMIQSLHPEWNVLSTSFIDEGVNLVASATVKTPTDHRDIILKAPETAKDNPKHTEPYLLQLISEHTSLPVPTVYGICDTHDVFPTPYYTQQAHVGVNPEQHPKDPSLRTTHQHLRTAASHLATLHSHTSFDAAGHIGTRNGSLTVVDSSDHPRHGSSHSWIQDYCDWKVEKIASNPDYADLTTNPNRFTDILPQIESYVETAIPSLIEAHDPVISHWDYRPGNLLVDPDTYEIQSILDWGKLLALEPAYNLAAVEEHFLRAHPETNQETQTLRHAFRTAYSEARDDWTLDKGASERLELYRVVCHLDEIHAFPLWYQHASESVRDWREREIRSFINRVC